MKVLNGCSNKIPDFPFPWISPFGQTVSSNQSLLTRNLPDFELGGEEAQRKGLHKRFAFFSNESIVSNSFQSSSPLHLRANQEISRTCFFFFLFLHQESKKIQNGTLTKNQVNNFYFLALNWYSRNSFDKISQLRKFDRIHYRFDLPLWNFFIPQNNSEMYVLIFLYRNKLLFLSLCTNCKTTDRVNDQLSQVFPK